MASAETHTLMRRHARDIFAHALHESDVGRAFARHVQAGRGVLRVGDDLYSLDDVSRIFAVAFGKAAHGMARALGEQLGGMLSGIISAPQSAEPQVEGFRYFAGAHPLPDRESEKAAEAILKSLRALDDRALVLYLISGGGSAMVEKPLDDEISLDDLIATHRVLVGSGAKIAEMNAIRKHLSAVKGGRMAQAVKPGVKQVSIMVSDVPEDALDALASGPTMPDRSSVEECYAIAERYGMVAKLPPPVRELFAKKYLAETPDADDPLFHYSRWWPILSNQDAVKAAARKASELGFAVEIDNSCDEWDYTRAADYLLERLRRLRAGASRICLISGGEVSVPLPAEPGIGGRNQQFALYCAAHITSENITVLSAGTDGMDGNSPAAGAIADGTTTLRHSALGSGVSVDKALKACDAHPFFAALGDDVTTGSTGTNVRDVRVLLAY